MNDVSWCWKAADLWNGDRIDKVKVEMSELTQDMYKDLDKESSSEKNVTKNPIKKVIEKKKI